MRVSSFHLSSTMLQSINTYTSKFIKLNEQMAHQKRVLVPSDDPIASSRLIQIGREKAAIDQYQRNGTRLNQTLSQQETHVNSVTKQLLTMRDQMISVSNGTTSANDMASYAKDLQAGLESIITTLNNKNEGGHYLFSGTATDKPAIVFDEESGKYVYQGNNEQIETTVGNGISIGQNVNAGTLFFDESNDFLNELNVLVASMKDPDTNFNSEEFQESLKSVLISIDQSIETVTSTLTDLGNRQNTINMIIDVNENLQLSNSQIERELADLDYAAATMEFNGYLVAAQAAQTTFMKISTLSLFDLIH